MVPPRAAGQPVSAASVSVGVPAVLCGQLRRFPAAGSPGCSPVRSLPFPCFPWCPALRPPHGPAPAGPVPLRCPVQAPPGSPLRRALRPALRSSQTLRSVRQAARRLPAVPVPWVLPPSGALPCCPQRIFPKKPPPGLFLPEELCFLLRFRPALLPDDGLHRHSPLQVGQIHGRPQTADGQHHGHGKNSRSHAPAACRKSVVPNSFHAVLLRLRIPVLVIVCRRKSGRPFMHFHTGSVYTRCRPAVNRLDCRHCAAARAGACVRTPEKCSKRDTFRWGKTLHKAEISCFCRPKSGFFLLS